jgi:hypothetical protein
MNAFIIDDRDLTDDVAVNGISAALQHHDPRCATAHMPDWDGYSLEILAKRRQQVQS